MVIPMRRLVQLSRWRSFARAKDRGLQAVEPRAASLKFVILLGDAPVIGGHAHSFRQFFTTGNDCAGIAIGAEILAGIEAECPDIAYRTDPAAVEFSPMGLSTILDKVMLCSNL